MQGHPYEHPKISHIHLSIQAYLPHQRNMAGDPKASDNVWGIYNNINSAKKGKTIWWQCDSVQLFIYAIKGETFWWQCEVCANILYI